MILTPCMAAISAGIEEKRFSPMMRYRSLVSAAIWTGKEVRALPLTSSDSRLIRLPMQLEGRLLSWLLYTYRCTRLVSRQISAGNVVNWLL